MIQLMKAAAPNGAAAASGRAGRIIDKTPATLYI